MTPPQAAWAGHLCCPGLREGGPARVGSVVPGPEGGKPGPQAGSRPGPEQALRWWNSRGSRLERRAPGARGPRAGDSGAGPAGRKANPCASRAGEGLLVRRLPRGLPGGGTRTALPNPARGALGAGPGRARTAAARAAGMLTTAGPAPRGRPGPPPQGSSCSPSRVTLAPTSRAGPFVCTQWRTLIFFFPRPRRLHARLSPSPGTPHRTQASLRTAFSLHTHFVSPFFNSIAVVEDVSIA